MSRVCEKGVSTYIAGKNSVSWFYCKNCKQEMEVKRENGEITIEPKSR